MRAHTNAVFKRLPFQPTKFRLTSPIVLRCCIYVPHPSDEGSSLIEEVYILVAARVASRVRHALPERSISLVRYKITKMIKK
uniref:Uncharacterized protein n=1 Tax=Helianthus annuus TaxID=4232 RepID=A0A251SA49_HELAN